VYGIQYYGNGDFRVEYCSIHGRDTIGYTAANGKITNFNLIWLNFSRSYVTLAIRLVAFPGRIVGWAERLVACPEFMLTGGAGKLKHYYGGSWFSISLLKKSWCRPSTAVQLSKQQIHSLNRKKSLLIPPPWWIILCCLTSSAYTEVSTIIQYRWKHNSIEARATLRLRSTINLPLH
jgi:hypothetical protein